MASHSLLCWQVMGKGYERHTHVPAVYTHRPDEIEHSTRTNEPTALAYLNTRNMAADI